MPLDNLKTQNLIVLGFVVVVVVYIVDLQTYFLQTPVIKASIFFIT
tara:strand:+ start:224 stop:361 length:138 start_codon:yes stop_codon:yes gene_type:complete